MARTLEDNLKSHIGHLVVELAAVQTQRDEALDKIKELEAQLQKKEEK